jgi:hypothetical protein
MKRGRTGVALAMAGLLVGGIWLGVAVTGHAATTQQVTASLECEPGTVKTTVGCLLTVTNEGGNNVTAVKVTITASAGTFLNSTDSRCAPSGSTLTCNIGKLTGFGKLDSTFTETHELQVPSTGTVVQTMIGRYSPNANNRGDDDITPFLPVETEVDSSNDFDGRFADGNGESVQTGTNLSGSNFYSTSATLTGTEFTVGLTVRERGASPNSPNCPTGCFGAEEIDFDITPIANTDFPMGYKLLIKIADAAIPNSVKDFELDVRHDGDPVPLCEDTDPEDEPCIDDRDIANSPKDATIVIIGPGDANGSWGVG